MDILDFQVSEWIEYLWAGGNGWNDAADTLSGISFLMRRRRILPASWNLFGAWRRIEVPSRVPPLPINVLLAMATTARAWQRNDIAVLMVLGFSGFLRTTEMLSLVRWQVQVSLDFSSVVVVLPITKSGLRRHTEESVVINDTTVARFVHHMLQHVAPGDTILQGSAAGFRRVFQLLLEGLELTEFGFKPYSLRRGGATAHFAAHRNMAATLLMGRWRDSEVARLYLSEGVQVLLQTALGEARLCRLQALAQSLCCDM